MRIIEIFHSVQGEGPWTGVRTSFVRTARCNLRCTWCDTTYSFGPGTARSVPSILREIRGHRTHFVCLTGGEPLLQKESVELVREVSKAGLTTIIETGGSLDVGPYLRIPRVVLSVDVKCPASRMQTRNRFENLSKLRPRDVLKFVIADRTDYDYARTVLRTHSSRAQSVFQPVYRTDPAKLAEWVLKDRLDVRVMLQEHKQIWGEARGR